MRKAQKSWMPQKPNQSHTSPSHCRITVGSLPTAWKSCVYCDISKYKSDLRPLTLERLSQFKNFRTFLGFCFCLKYFSKFLIKANIITKMLTSSVTWASTVEAAINIRACAACIQIFIFSPLTSLPYLISCVIPNPFLPCHSALPHVPDQPRRGAGGWQGEGNSSGTLLG